MYEMSGYYDYINREYLGTGDDFFVQCCGRYKLLHREVFTTERMHGLDNYQLLYVASGKAHFQIKGNMQIVEQGNCVLYHPGEPQYYEYRIEDKPDVYWIHFACNQSNPLLQQTGFGQDNLYPVGSHNSYILLYDQIIQELQLQEQHFETACMLLLQQLLTKMSRNISKKQDKNYSYDYQIEEAIKNFHASFEKNFTIKDYTREKSLNYYRFIDTFTKHTGIAPRQYIIQIRMAKAKELLTNSLLSIKDVALLIGYENPLYFSRLFRQAVGMSPSQYRESL